MADWIGWVKEIRLGSGGLQGRIACPPRAVPAPGRYLQAYAPAEPDAPLGVALFMAQPAMDGIWAASPFPATWGPGTRLAVRGPLGHGFDLPASLSRLALADLGDSPDRLLPLAYHALQQDCSVTLFTNSSPRDLPTSLEIYPLGLLRETVGWPDLLAIDLPLKRLPELRSLLGLAEHHPLPCQAQALLWVPMPCAGIGECGACAVPAQRGYTLACVDGPVFQLNSLAW
jgi:hypothetical protein